MAGGRQVEGAADGARAVFGRYQRLALLAGFALLVALRLPLAWAHGRFLDEEATVFLAYAWHRLWLDALFRPFGGYWNLAANASTLLTVTLVRGGALSLERAPYVTMTIALAVQLIPAALILTGRAGWLADRRAVVAALLMIAILPGTEEVFLNVMHIQFHLALAAALILALDPPRKLGARIGYGALLVAASLCGPGAIVILPLFALRALVERDRRRAEQAAAFAAGAAVQLLLFFGGSPMRGHLVDPATLAAVLFVRIIVLPTLNFGTALRLGTAVWQSWRHGGWGWWGAAAAAAVLFGALLVTALRRRDAAPWLVLAALAIAAASFGYGMVVSDPASLFHVGAGERYAFLPTALIGLALIVVARRPQGRAALPCALLALLMLVSGAIRYPWPIADVADGPSWPAEVAAWRRDHRHSLAVWPRPWAADLSDADPPCPPAGRDPAASIAPRYCVGGWVAGFYRPAATKRAPPPL